MAIGPEIPKPIGIKKDVEMWRDTKDPIQLFKKRLVDAGDFTIAELNQVEEAAKEEADAAAEFAINSPNPDPADVMADVFYEA